MNALKTLFALCFFLTLAACNLQNTLSHENSASPTLDNALASGQPGSSESGQPPQAAPADLPVPSDPASLIQPGDLEYLGAFRLPGESGGSSWDYSGRGLTYYPEGDPEGAVDGFPGSLFGVGHDQSNYVSEITIPAPVISRNLEDLNTAATIQPFADITAGIFGETEIPRLGIQYLDGSAGQAGGKLHFVHGQHFQDFEPSHGWSDLTLADPQTAGPWLFDGYTNYVTSDYVFEIPAEWAQLLPGGPRLATGRFREGVWGGLGPALFAYSPLENIEIPAPGATLTNITPLLLYGTQEPGLPDIVSAEGQQMALYNADDSWWGGAWLTRGERSAVIFVGTKGLGKSWYGFADGTVWDYGCAETNPPSCPEVPAWPYESRGYWAEDYQPQLIFYVPTDLVRVANGEMETWEPQPYGFLDLSSAFYDPEIDLGEYKFDITGAAAFDRERGLIFVIERLADEYRSVIHVWKINN